MSEQMIGKYRLLEKRGEGGFGVLYKAEDTLIERTVALKLLHTQYVTNERLSSWFRREARAMARLNHANIVTIHNFEIEGDHHFIIMEYVDGPNLDELLRDKRYLPPDETVRIARQLVDAFGYAHDAGIIHRDIKPSNVMVDSSGRVKITDFGIAKILGDSKLTKTGTGAGSIHYMSPEQIEGRQIDARTDIYSLGITIYQMLTGAVPFTDESEFVVMRAHLDQEPTKPSEIRESIPTEVENIVLKMLQKKPESRYESMHSIARELDEIITGQKSSDHEVKPRQTVESADDQKTRPTVTTEKTVQVGEGIPPKQRKKSKLPIILMPVISVAIIVAAYFGFVRKQDELPTEPVVTEDTTSTVADSESDTTSGKDTVATTPVVAEPPKPRYTGSLTIEVAPYDFNNKPVMYFIGERHTINDTPFTLKGLKKGTHKLKVLYKDDSFVEYVKIGEGNTSRSYKFNGPKGKVSIGARFVGESKQPWANIIVDGKETGLGTPALVELTAGPHEISVSRDGYKLITRPQIVSVNPNESENVVFELRKE